MSGGGQSLKCPNCGAPATEGGSRCDYCRARLATVSCPSCFGVLFDGAAFCQHCGAARRRSESFDAQRVACSACKGQMSWVRVGEADLLECGTCEGTWLEASTFERICAERESQAAVLPMVRPMVRLKPDPTYATKPDPSYATKPAPPYTTRERPAPSATLPVRYRPCLRCGKMMNRINFGKSSGAVIDVCKGHGTFLDRGELHQIVRFIRSGGLDRARTAERE
jgi:Zn-finger nucleic acid-binding protein